MDYAEKEKLTAAIQRCLVYELAGVWWDDGDVYFTTNYTNLEDGIFEIGIDTDEGLFEFELLVRNLRPGGDLNEEA